MRAMACAHVLSLSLSLSFFFIYLRALGSNPPSGRLERGSNRFATGVGACGTRILSCSGGRDSTHLDVAHCMWHGRSGCQRRESSVVYSLRKPCDGDECTRNRLTSWITSYSGTRVDGWLCRRICRWLMELEQR